MIHSLKIYAIKGISDGNNEFETIKNQIPEDIHKFTKDFIVFFNADENIEDKEYSPYNLLTNFKKNKNNLLDLSIESSALEVAKYLHNNGAEICDIHLPELIEFIDLDVIKFVVKDCKRGVGENELINAIEREDMDLIKYFIEECKINISLRMMAQIISCPDIYDIDNDDIKYIYEKFIYGINQTMLYRANKYNNTKFAEHIKTTYNLIPEDECVKENTNIDYDLDDNLD